MATRTGEDTLERSANYPEIEGDTEAVSKLFRDTRWHGFDDFWQPYHRVVESNLRMVAGRHWDVFIDLLGRFVNVTEFMTDEEKSWRQRPVFNWIGYWYQITHAKLIENQPLVSFLPSTADRGDALLAEVMDPIYKHLWDTIGMPDKHDSLMGWMVAAGRGATKSYWDPDAGVIETMEGPAMVTGPDGTPQLIERAPLGKHPETGELVPLIQIGPEGQIIETGKAGRIPQGDINVDILSPIEVRTSPEPAPEWEKRWVVHRGVMHVDEIEERYEIQVEPDVEPGDDDKMSQLLFGLGNMGAAELSPRKPLQMGKEERAAGFAWVYECWERPRFDVQGMEEGRHVMVLGREGGNIGVDEVTPEGPDYWPIHMYDFIRLPGRPAGKSPVEDLKPIQQSYNRGWGQILEHRALMTNPIWVSIGAAGDVEITNAPGQHINVPFAGPGVVPLQAVQPAPLSADVWRTQEMLLGTLQDIGSLRSGSEGRPPTRSASGELVKELRFNDDRFIGPSAIRTVSNYARMVQQAWIPLLRYGWDDERMIRTSGEENRARWMLVRPDMFKGQINVKPVPESMLPEGRQGRQERVDRMYDRGILGPPGSPEATAAYLELINFPHMGRAARPGGVDREMAEWENAQLLQGQLVLPIEHHLDEVHFEIHRSVMASPDFSKLDEEIQALFEMHVKAHEQATQTKMLKAAVQTTALQDAVGQTQGAGQPAPSGI